MSEHTCGGRGPVPCPGCTADAARAGYVRAWRAQYPRLVFSDGYRCPLCNAVLAGRGCDVSPSTIEAHQQAHGSHWGRYMALALQPAET